MTPVCRVLLVCFHRAASPDELPDGIFWGTLGQPGLAAVQGLGDRSSAGPQGRACGHEAFGGAEL